MEKYQYTPLPQGYTEIRLIKLQPGLPGTNIQIEIFHTLISSHPEYEALSYTWGCPDRTQVVHVQAPGIRNNGKPHHKLSKVFDRLKPQRYRKEHQNTSSLGIAHNLFVALQHLRHSNNSRVLWIDAICINQDDKDERSAEVIEMGSIYRNASQVIVWLGLSSHNSDLALQTLSRIGDAVICLPEQGLTRETPGSWPATLRNDVEALKSHADRWLSIKDLITREWFSRLWVFQEIVLAQKATLVVGEARLDWKIFARGLEWVWMMSGQLDQLIESLGVGNIFADTIWAFVRQGCNPTAQYLNQMLYNIQKLLCSDPRDRLYAIRSLLHPSNSEIIIPNYSLSVREVYTNFAKEWLLKLDDAYFLEFCDFPEPLTGIDLPSWVPDWSRARTAKVFEYGRCSGLSGAFPALDRNRLGLQGTLVGNISYVTPPAQSRTTVAEIRELCHSWMQLVSTDELVRGGSTVTDSFMETIVGGSVSERQPSMEQNNRSVDEIKIFFANVSGNDDSFRGNNVPHEIQRTIQGCLFFKTAEGLFGVGPRSAKPGDRVAVILGCSFPVVLRPDELSGRNCFQVVGHCYVSEIMSAEALLGPLHSGWSARWESVQGERVQMFRNGDTRTQQDPRMPPLPPGWEYRYGDEEAPQEIEAEKLEDMTPQWFGNVETGEKTYKDPRLTTEHLKEMGVAIEELILI
ncbi:hypothetical protein EG329_005079 [Mollisiaceae sp. DMI_Dod_QoI]|nr:hypothetical protein EG329_005079 [Helotiales sp. DMI_Dod_QoI]